MPMPMDNNRNIMQVFAPDGTVDVASGEINVLGIAAVVFNTDVNYTVKSGEPAMPLTAGNVLGVGHLTRLTIDTAATMAFMRGA